MTTTTTRTRPARDLPYTMRLPDGRTVAVAIPAGMVVNDPSEGVCFNPEGVRFLDRVRALFAPMDAPTPGFLRSLREAMGATQETFGRAAGVDRLTVSRWERGELRPGPKSLRRLRTLRTAALRRGVALPDGGTPRAPRRNRGGAE